MAKKVTVRKPAAKKTAAATAKKRTTKSTAAKKATAKNPKVGQFVFDKHYQKKRKVIAIHKNGNDLYFIGQEHEPVRRHEFLFPCPKTIDGLEGRPSRATRQVAKAVKTAKKEGEKVAQKQLVKTSKTKMF